MSEKNSKYVGIYSYSRAQSTPSIGNVSAPFGNLYPISERVNDSIKNHPAENNPPEKLLQPHLHQLEICLTYQKV